MKNYEIIKRRTGGNAWEVWWDGVRVWKGTGPDAQYFAGNFADGLERGITGSKHSLMANSQVKLEGFMTYLEAFDSYEDFKGE